jgi:hypothetical protein
MYHKNVVSNEEDLCRVVYVDIYIFLLLLGRHLKPKVPRRKDLFFNSLLKGLTEFIITTYMGVCLRVAHGAEKVGHLVVLHTCSHFNLTSSWQLCGI